MVYSEHRPPSRPNRGGRQRGASHCCPASARERRRDGAFRGIKGGSKATRADRHTAVQMQDAGKKNPPQPEGAWRSGVRPHTHGHTRHACTRARLDPNTPTHPPTQRLTHNSKGAAATPPPPGSLLPPPSPPPSRPVPPLFSPLAVNHHYILRSPSSPFLSLSLLLHLSTRSSPPFSLNRLRRHSHSFAGVQDTQATHIDHRPSQPCQTSTNLDNTTDLVFPLRQHTTHPPPLPRFFTPTTTIHQPIEDAFHCSSYSGLLGLVSLGCRHSRGQASGCCRQ